MLTVCVVNFPPFIQRIYLDKGGYWKVLSEDTVLLGFQIIWFFR